MSAQMLLERRLSIQAATSMTWRAAQAMAATWQLWASAAD